LLRVGGVVGQYQRDRMLGGQYRIDQISLPDDWHL
jgi:hypothetical protein